MTYAIIAVGYNRPLEMKRLLDSLCQAQIGDIEVDLIISLDKSDKQEDLKKICEEIQWDHGEKIIRPFSERQGLRNHILQCGDLTDRYDAVIVLEDDRLTFLFRCFRNLREVLICLRHRKYRIRINIHQYHLII